MQKNTLKKVQVFILTYNRPDLVALSIDSVMKQSYGNIDIIVSDNSTNNDTNTLIKNKYFNNIKYIHRVPSLLPLSHFNTVLSEVTADYFMMFHDDDTMCENMVTNLVSEVRNNKAAVAVGANAFVVINKKLRRQLFRSKRIKRQIINNRTELIKNYLANSIVPFSSYMYKSEISLKLVFNPKYGGKHADVAFLMNVCDMGPIINLDKPLMYYHFHNNQDSFDFDYHSRNLLANYIINTTKYNRKDKEILKFRALSLYSRTLSSIKHSDFTLFSWKSKRIVSIMFQVSPYNYFLKLVGKMIVAKLLGLMRKTKK